MSERAIRIAKAVVSSWRSKDAVPCIAEGIDAAITERDEVDTRNFAGMRVEICTSDDV